MARSALVKGLLPSLEQGLIRPGLGLLLYQTNQSCKYSSQIEYIQGVSNLAYHEIIDKSKGEPVYTGIFVHGFLGQGRNWRGFAKQFVQQSYDKYKQTWRILCPDLRGHGNSASMKLEGPHDMDSAGKDLMEFIQLQTDAPPDIVAGHSLGGKVVARAISQMENIKGPLNRLTPQMWMLDSFPGTLHERTTDTDLVVEQVSQIQQPIADKQELSKMLQQKGFTLDLVNWLLSSLVPAKGGGYQFQHDLQACRELYQSYRSLEAWRMVMTPPPTVHTHFVVAEHSSLWQGAGGDELAQVIQNHDSTYRAWGYGGLTVHELQNSGHWLHVDNPKGLMELMHSQVCSEAKSKRSCDGDRIVGGQDIGGIVR